MRFGVLYAIALFLSQSLPLVNAIYVDEAYSSDYHHALIGAPKPHTTFFHRPTAKSKGSILYSLSEEHFLGAVNPKDGSLVWRQQLAPASHNASREGFLATFDGFDLIISAVNGAIQAWDAADGRFAWEWRFSGKVKDLKTFGKYTKDVGIFVLTEEGNKGVVRKLSAETGSLVWHYKDRSHGDIPFQISLSSQHIYYVSLHSAVFQGYKIINHLLDPLTGESKSQITLNSEKELSREDPVYLDNVKSTSHLIIWTDRSYTSLKINPIGTKHVMSTPITSTSEMDVRSLNVFTVAITESRIHVLVHYETVDVHWAEIWYVDLDTISFQKVIDLPRIPDTGSFSSIRDDNDAYFVRNTMSEITLLSASAGKILESWPVSRKSNSGSNERDGIAHAISEVVPKGNLKFAVRSAQVFRSGDWELVRNGDLVWHRPESLVGVTAAAWADFPHQQDLARELATEGHAHVITAYIHRLERHLRDLKRTPNWAHGLYYRILNAIDGQSYVQQQDSSDNRFGFHKIIILATVSGRVAALNSGKNGAVIWSIQAVTVSEHTNWVVTGIEIENGIALVRAAGGEYLRIQVLTGEVLEHHPSGLTQPLMNSIPIFDRLGKKFFLPVNDDGSVGDVPQGCDPAPSIIATRDLDGIVRGWTLGAGVRPTTVWEFIPMPGEIICNVTFRPWHDPVASIGVALGNRNVLYKYLDRNAFLLCSIIPKTETAIFYLVDSTSGAILHVTKHSEVDLSKPVTSTISENWFAYSLFSNIAPSTSDADVQDRSLSNSYQLITSELFESQIPNDRGTLGDATFASSIYPDLHEVDGPVSAPYVLSQSYQIAGPISSMSTTSTLQGITPRSLLCVLPSLNAIIAIPRAMVDPRQPIGRDPTPAEIEEGLFSHTGLIDFEPKWVVSHMQEVLGVSEIITSPSLLESTSLVLAYGHLDIFGTRIAPIGGFDLLGKGFSKLQLMGTVSALMVATAVLGPMVSEHILRTKSLRHI
ncbi:MAG: hypothetical protein Q9167_001635 [Letrouitia subvulpina]